MPLNPNRVGAGSPNGGQFAMGDSRRDDVGQVVLDRGPDTGDIAVMCDPSQPLGVRMTALRSGEAQAKWLLARDPDPVVRWHVLNDFRDELFASERSRLEADEQVHEVDRVFAARSQ